MPHKNKLNRLLVLVTIFVLTSCAVTSDSNSPWLLIDNFEKPDALSHWILKDTRNDTDPFVSKPQVTERQLDINTANHFLLKKPAAEGVFGNRKALSYLKLPVAVQVGERYTFFTRVNIEYFPNNHVFGLSNLNEEGIAEHDYNAFEPSIRITDKTESNGYKNDGTLMVKTDHAYAKIINPKTGNAAKPMQTDVWYDIWYVVDNARKENGGQKYDLYIQGGTEFPTQSKVYSGAGFRMKRELPLTYFLTNTNTGPKKTPYGNGGVRYDDIYMAKGEVLSLPN